MIEIEIASSLPPRNDTGGNSAAAGLRLLRRCLLAMTRAGIVPLLAWDCFVVPPRNDTGGNSAADGLGLLRRASSQ